MNLPRGAAATGRVKSDRMEFFISSGGIKRYEYSDGALQEAGTVSYMSRLLILENADVYETDGNEIHKIMI